MIPEIATEIEPRLRHVLQTGESIINGLVQGTTPAHPMTTRTYMHNYSPVTSANGAVVGVLCVVHDVTEATENLERALADAKRLSDPSASEEVIIGVCI